MVLGRCCNVGSSYFVQCFDLTALALIKYTECIQANNLYLIIFFFCSLVIDQTCQNDNCCRGAVLSRGSGITMELSVPSAIKRRYIFAFLERQKTQIPARLCSAAWFLTTMGFTVFNVEEIQ